MANRRMITVDGNEAAARVAHALSEVIAIYPITPASPMGELADLWSTQKKPNMWGTTPQVVEMQAEGGAAGAEHEERLLTAAGMLEHYALEDPEILGQLLGIPEVVQIQPIHVSAVQGSKRGGLHELGDDHLVDRGRHRITVR